MDEKLLTQELKRLAQATGLHGWCDWAHPGSCKPAHATVLPLSWLLLARTALKSWGLFLLGAASHEFSETACPVLLGNVLIS